MSGTVKWFVLLAAVGVPVVAATVAGVLAARKTPEILFAANGRAELSLVVPEKPSPTEKFAAPELQR